MYEWGEVKKVPGNKIAITIFSWTVCWAIVIILKIYFDNIFCLCVRSEHWCIIINEWDNWKNEVTWDSLALVDDGSKKRRTERESRKSQCTHTVLENFIMSNKLGHSMDNGNKLKWIIGTHGNWKNQNSGGHFGATS